MKQSVSVMGYNIEEIITIVVSSDTSSMIYFIMISQHTIEISSQKNLIKYHFYYYFEEKFKKIKMENDYYITYLPFKLQLSSKLFERNRKHSKIS